MTFAIDNDVYKEHNLQGICGCVSLDEYVMHFIVACCPYILNLFICTCLYMYLRACMSVFICVHICVCLSVSIYIKLNIRTDIAI